MQLQTSLSKQNVDNFGDPFSEQKEAESRANWYHLLLRSKTGHAWHCAVFAANYLQLFEAKPVYKRTNQYNKSI